MGFGKVGYLYPLNYVSNLHFYKTLGHELGHGIFDLKHPFRDDDKDDSYYNDNVNRECYLRPDIGNAGGSDNPANFHDSNNLIDYYKTGVLLRAYQWDLIKNKLPLDN